MMIVIKDSKRGVGQNHKDIQQRGVRKSSTKQLKFHKVNKKKERKTERKKERKKETRQVVYV